MLDGTLFMYFRQVSHTAVPTKVLDERPGRLASPALGTPANKAVRPYPARYPA